MKRYIILPLLFLSFLGFGQLKENYVQFSGVVLSSDSIEPMAFCHIYIKGENRGTISDMNGFFSFVATKGDHIIFDMVGYKKKSFIIPDSLKEKTYSIIQLLTQDTIYLDETVITPLPNRNLFDYYFVKTEVPDDALEIARKNLEREALKERAMKMGPDGREASKMVLQNQARQYYYAGQMPPMNIFSPLAWAKFFKAWKNGDFKKK
ncbi:MAG: Uncharacterised protein [Bacteroidetes bacterium MED-G17]|nr:MAG: Uncharacterised protein [Bacteroidetes bacterium MED-G17]